MYVFVKFGYVWIRMSWLACSKSGLRYSYGISASVRLNCWLQGRKLLGKIQQKGLEFTQKVQLSLFCFSPNN